jgi:hypothetical protein
VPRILLFAAMFSLLATDQAWAQVGRVRNRLQSATPTPYGSSELPPAARQAAEKLALERSPTPIVGQPTPAQLPVYYFDGHVHWCGLPDNSSWVWTGTIWVPPGVIYWGARKYDTAARGDSQSNPASYSRGLWIHSRFNVESQDYRSRYGNDAYFRYGPGHFID